MIDPNPKEELFFISEPETKTFIGARRHAIIKMLASEGSAENVEGGWQIPVERLLMMDDDHLDLLELPPLFPGSLNLEEKGVFTDRDFHYKILVIGRDGIEWTNAKLQSGQIHIGKISYRLSPELYRLVREVDLAASEPPVASLTPEEITAFNLKRFKVIRELANRANVKMSRFLEAEEVVEPNAIIPLLDPLEDGSCDLLPLPAYKKSDVPEDNAEPIIPLEAVSDFKRRSFRRPEFLFHGARSEKGNVRILMKPQIREGIKELRSLGRLSRDEAQFFMRNPEMFLQSPVFDLENYSERVIDIGKLSFRTNPSVSGRGMVQNWNQLAIMIGSEFGVLPARELKIKTQEELDELRESWRETMDCDADHIAFREALYERDDHYLADLIRRTEILLSIKQQENQLVGNGIKSKPEHLLIKMNISEVEYRLGEKPSDKHVAQLPKSLAPGIHLFPHQEEGLAWLQAIHQGRTGGILADDMGLGKTLQILAYIIRAHEDGAKGPFLVIAPLSVINVWIEEIKSRFTVNYQNRVLVLDETFFKNPQHQMNCTTVRTRDGKERVIRAKAISEEGMKKIRDAVIVLCHYELFEPIKSALEA